MTGLSVQRVQHGRDRIGYVVTLLPDDGQPVSAELTSEQWGAFVAAGVRSLTAPLGDGIPPPPI